MNPNDILAIFTAPDFNISDLSADDLATYRDGLTASIAALGAALQAGELTALTADDEASVTYAKDTIGTIDAEVARRAEADAQAIVDAEAERIRLAALLDVDLAPAGGGTTEPEGEPEVERGPVTASTKFTFPTVPARQAESTAGIDPAVTASATAEVQYYSQKTSETDDHRPLTDKALTAAWHRALSVPVGGGQARIAVAEIALRHAVKASDYSPTDKTGNMFADAHTAWKNSRQDYLLARREGLTQRQADQVNAAWLGVIALGRDATYVMHAWQGTG